MNEVSLRPLNLADVPTFVRWAAGEEFCRATGWTVNRAPTEVREFWERLIQAPPPAFLRLCVTQGGALVGYVDLAGITDQTAEFGIAIGERDLWGHGVGRRAGVLTLQHGFDELNLPEITAEVHHPNERSHALIRRLGFTETGQGDLDTFLGERVPLIRYVLRAADFTA